ncbi:MAG: acyl-ACP--UDP-N-acetylglucosamine O-acyltransferase [Proteobacteria bacterium]|jgi:UDP-N-acetylglucosamine acyltransferase|nr:acyl-ACP--UDP-N-acetylglucosamine O-acyltransferase [Pseudomonadota bacterium]
MPNKIHPTAIVDPGAKLSDKVEIGPYSIIGKHVEIGEGSVIGNHVTITGHTKIGKANKIFHYCSLGETPQDKKYNNEPTSLVIGDRNTIREFCTFNCGTAQDKKVTTIGNDNWIMAYVHIAHDCELGNNLILANNSSLAGHVEIDDYAILGGFTLVHQFCKIGSHSITAVGSVIFKDVPPFIIAAGYNAKPNGINSEGLKRRDFSSDDIALIKKGYKVIYRDGNTINEAINILQGMAENSLVINPYIDFIEKSTRGIVR